jgi:hypothetical protein
MPCPAHPPFQLLNFFAPEHGKGACDGETAVIKQFVRSVFAKGAFVMTLTALCQLLSDNLSELSQSEKRTHTVTQRRFRTVHGNYSCVLLHHLPPTPS